MNKNDTRLSDWAVKKVETEFRDDVCLLLEHKTLKIEKANIGLSHISDIELGKTKMMLATFTRIAEALQISTDVLIRPDIPEVNNLYQNEFAEILGDCTPDEIDSIIKIVKELKATMHSNKNIYDE